MASGGDEDEADSAEESEAEVAEEEDLAFQAEWDESEQLEKCVERVMSAASWSRADAELALETAGFDLDDAILALLKFGPPPP